jgi:hypothetical protein
MFYFILLTKGSKLKTGFFPCPLAQSAVIYGFLI